MTIQPPEQEAHDKVARNLHEQEDQRIALGQRGVRDGQHDGTQECVEGGTYRHLLGHKELIGKEKPYNPRHQHDEGDEKRRDDEHAHVNLLIDGAVEALQIAVCR